MAKAGGNAALVQCVLIMALIIISVSSTTICNVEMNDLLECVPAITGAHPPKPSAGCCKVVHRVNLPCLCKYKSQLAKYGANPAAAMALPKKCGLQAPTCST